MGLRLYYQIAPQGADSTWPLALPNHHRWWAIGGKLELPVFEHVLGSLTVLVSIITSRAHTNEPQLLRYYRLPRILLFFFGVIFIFLRTPTYNRQGRLGELWVLCPPFRNFNDIKHRKVLCRIART